MNPEDPGAGGPAADPGMPAPRAAEPAPPPEGARLAKLEGTLEKIAGELLRQQRSERRWRLFFRFAWFALVLAVAWGTLAHRVAPTATSARHTALIDVRGEISQDAEANAEGLVAALRSAFEDSGAQAIVLRIDSPGGSPVQSGIVNDEIRRLKALHHKKVYAVVEDICASGAYYIAVAADEIYVDKASLVGSIGVLMDGFGFVGLMNKLGIERRLLTAGENKGMLDPFSPQNPQQTAYAQAMIEQIHQQFIDVVRAGRGSRLKDSPDLFSGLVWTGAHSVEMGLADGMGTVDSVARDVIKAEDVVDYTLTAELDPKAHTVFGAAVGQGAVRALASLPMLR
jgi:protease-4